jgi:hypothetical protein
VDTHFIGWDVGGWNCEKNRKSRDAIVILASDLKVVGKPWRGNLKEAINEAKGAREFAAQLYRLCSAPVRAGPILLGVDTPLGFSTEFVQLVSKRIAVETLDRSADNPYLFRATERFLHQRGKSPLSPIKDMIGSQATKGMHVLARFAPQILECGVWTDGKRLRIAEVYPAACKNSGCMQELRNQYQSLADPDQDDALTCALTAHLLQRNRGALFEPPRATPPEEGWIWVPRDGFSRDNNRQTEDGIL